MIGETLNQRYRILSILGTGRCGQTYMAEDDKATGDPRCVIKQLEPEAQDTLSLRKAKYLFAREVKVLQILGQSDRIPTLLAHFQVGNKFYLVHEFIDGKDLAAELGSRNWSEVEVIALLKEILEIVEVAHREKVIHQDIKPTNIIRRKADRKLILIDFGSVKKIYNQIANDKGQTEITVPIGTAGYMSPEQKSIKPKLGSDVYAVGVIGIYALTGVEPENLAIDHETEELEWRSLTEVSDKLGEILERMVSPNLRQRYSSASEALQSVRSYQPSKLFNFKLATVLGALFLAIAGAGYYYWQLENSIFPTSQGEYFEQESDRFPFLYQNSQQGVEIKYPSNWKLTEAQGDGQDIANFTLQTKKPRSIVPKVELRVENTNADSLEGYTTSAVYQITQLPQAEIVDSQPTTLNQQPAYKIVYTQADAQQSKETKHLKIWTLKGDRIYTLSYGAAIAEYNNFVSLVENEMFQSFKIIADL